MTFKVILTQRARADVKGIVAYYKRHSPHTAEKWLREFRALQESLAVFPSRFALSKNSRLINNTYRVAQHYSHRVIFSIDEQNNTVSIARIYHGARKPFESDEDFEFE